VLFSVPQGSVLGLLLYVLYTAELFSVVMQHQLRLHMYADDVTTPANNAAVAVTCLSDAIADITDWMRASRLRLNPSDSQLTMDVHVAAISATITYVNNVL